MRDKLDPALGARVREHLIGLNLETLKKDPMPIDARDELRDGIYAFLCKMGLDAENDDSIAGSPERIADMFAFELCEGLQYGGFPKCTMQENINGLDEMVMLRDITTISLCEHHFQTIAGRTHIAYIPNGQLLGVSKLARVTNFFARRPQVQERMTAQIFYALQLVLGTEDVAVQQECAHYCIRARGVMDPNSMMTTNKLGGRFMTNAALRQEFLHAIGK